MGTGGPHIFVVSRILAIRLTATYKCGTRSAECGIKGRTATVCATATPSPRRGSVEKEGIRYLRPPRAGRPAAGLRPGLHNKRPDGAWCGNTNLQSAFYNLQLVHGFRPGRGLQCGCAPEDRPAPVRPQGEGGKKFPFSPNRRTLKHG